MNKIYKVGYTPTSGGDSIATLVSFLCSSGGWTCPAWSDGTTVHTDGSVPTAAALVHPWAWVVIQQPNPVGTPNPQSGVRQFLFQRTNDSTAANNYTWIAAYSFSGGFTHSPSIAGTSQNAPLASDVQWLCGSFWNNLPANPSPGQLFQADQTYRIHMMVNVDAPFQWWLFSFPGTNGGVVTVISFDAMLSPLPEDPDPYVADAHFDSYGNCLTTSHLSDDSGGPGAYLKKGQLGGGWVHVGLCMLNTNSGNVFPDNAGTDPENQNDDFCIAMYARHSRNATPVGYKGISSIYQWSSPARSLGDTENQGGANSNYLRLGQVAVDWNGSTPLL